MKIEIPDDAINDFQRETIFRVIDRAKHAHYTNIEIRISGTDEWHEADWIKYMQVEP